MSSVDLPSNSIHKNLAWWAVTRRTSKKHKTVKIGGWALARVWALAKYNTVFTIGVYRWPYLDSILKHSTVNYSIV